MRVAIIAGKGDFPLYIAEQLKDVFVLCVDQHSSSVLFKKKSVTVSLLDPESWIKALKMNGITHVVIAGKFDRPKIINQRISEAAQIPSDSIKKKITSSNEDLTGFLNLTIDKAPIIPKDKAILPAITLVIAKVIIGKSTNVMVPEKVLIQFWLCIPTDVLVTRENKTNTAIAMILS